MPSELPKPKPKRSEEIEEIEEIESSEEKKEKNYTPTNKLGLPVAKFLPKELLQNAMQEAAGDWEKDNEADELEIKRISPRTFIAIGLLMILMLGWVLYEALSDKAPEEQGKGVVKVPIPSGFVALEDELKEKANQFLAAENWEDVLPLIRRSAGIEEKLKIYQARLPKEIGVIQQFRPIDVIRVRGGDFLYMLGVQDQNQTVKNLYFTSEEPHLIIWETFVAYCEEPFENLSSPQNKSQSENIYRVRVKADDYYLGAYSEKDWQALSLTHPMSQRNILCYVKRDSDQGRKLKPVLYGRKDAVPLVLLVKSKIENEENSSPEVLDLIGIGWHEN